MIERHNILELFGKHRGKYHSCILTCYSLDFSFFEERVLPVLRTANIKNINVFADGKFLENAQEYTSGREFRQNKTYSFHPIYASGVFHPKIMLLTGVRHGLLFIGSGNITSAGLNTNDEIWGAFHLDNLENENAPLFEQVWKYLKQFFNQIHGFAQQKIEWIRKYSSWLQELPVANKPIEIESLKQTITFLHNSPRTSIYQQIVTAIPKNKLSELTIISPYYDLKGELLIELYKHYKPETINCIVDAEYGLLPNEMDEKVKKGISFYNWKDCKKDYNEQFNRLHAKIFHFQFENGIEFMFLGSANATVAAVGTALKLPLNIEAGVLISKQSKTNLLKELDIVIPKYKSIDITQIKPNHRTLLPAETSRRFKTKIIYSELKGDELTIYFKENTSLEGNVSILSNISVQVDIVSFFAKEDKIIIKCKTPDEIFKICITDNAGNAISNFSIVHRFDYLLKCNPDPQQQKLDNCLEQDFPNEEGYTELLQFVDYNWADDDSQKEVKRHSRVNGVSKSLETDSEKKYEKLSAKEFNTISNEMLLRQAGELTSANVKIADFLHIVGQDLFSKSEDTFEESEEHKLFEDTEQRGDGSNVAASVRPVHLGQKEKKAISYYFKKLNEQYNNQLSRFFESAALTESPKDEITIKNLSNILIALQLIQLYWNKKYTVEVVDETTNEKEVWEETYLIEGNLYSDCDTVKGFMIYGFGKFLLLATGKFKNYEYEILTQKLNNSRKQIFNKAIFIILNLQWNETEEDYRKTLLLNTLYFLSPEIAHDNNCFQNLKEQIEKIKVNAKYISNNFEGNVFYLFEKLLPQFIRWRKMFDELGSRNKLVKETGEVNSGTIIFNSKVGFNVVYKRYHYKEKILLSLKRTGYDWVEEDSVCLLENIEYPKKCVIFS